MLKAVTSSMLDPQAFVARVQYLYRHPEAEGHDRLETVDGRSSIVVPARCARLDGSFSAASGSSATSPKKSAWQRKEERQNFRFEAAAQQHDAGPVHVRSRHAPHRIEPPLCRDLRLRRKTFASGCRSRTCYEQRLEAGNEPIGEARPLSRIRLAMVDRPPGRRLRGRVGGWTRDPRSGISPWPMAAGWRLTKTSPSSAAIRRAFSIWPGTTP